MLCNICDTAIGFYRLAKALIGMGETSQAEKAIESGLLVDAGMNTIVIVVLVVVLYLPLRVPICF